jgi:type 1 glutamine amidotransferase
VTARPRILLVSSGLVHPSLGARRALRDALESADRWEIEPVKGVEALKDRSLKDVAALVCSFHQRDASDGALATVGGFVLAGGGLLAVHAASASFKRSELWYRILGGRFERHGPVRRFRVEPGDPDDEILGPVPAFEVRDELYRHRFEPDVRVHLHTEVDGAREPVAWTRAHGLGRVAYLSLGHKAKALRHPAVRPILTRGLAWAAGAAPSR